VDPLPESHEEKRRFSPPSGERTGGGWRDRDRREKERRGLGNRWREVTARRNGRKKRGNRGKGARRKIAQGGSSVCQRRKLVRYGPSTRIERDTRNFPILKADTPSNTVGEKEERGRGEKRAG